MLTMARSAVLSIHKTTTYVDLLRPRRWRPSRMLMQPAAQWSHVTVWPKTRVWRRWKRCALRGVFDRCGLAYEGRVRRARGARAPLFRLSDASQGIVARCGGAGRG